MRNLANVFVMVFVMVFVLLIALTAKNAFGQETFTPLITDNTVAFIHVDLRKIEVDTIKSQAEKLGGDLLKMLEFDEKSLKATNRELKVELDKLDNIVRLPYETITKKLGIQELALIVDFDLIESKVPAIFVAPWKNKTQDDLKTLLSLLPLEETPLELIPFGDFLFLSLADHNEAAKLALIAWLQNVKPSKDARIYQALQSLGQDEIKITAALPEKLKQKLASLPFPDDISKEVQNVLIFALQKAEWAAASFPIIPLANNLLANEKTNEKSTLLTVKMNKRTDAVQFRALLENSIEFGIIAMRIAIEQDEDKEIQLPPLFFEFVKGCLRTLLPDIENDKLIFRAKDGIWGSKTSAFGTSGVAIALLLPAVQAAREAARRMQCVNNLKQIMIGLHNYHDTYEAFPPLYTVDKNGKPLHSWRVLILPFIEKNELYEKIRLDEAWDSEHNKQFHNIVIDAYRCPTNAIIAQKHGLCSYSVIAGEMFVPAKKAGEIKGKTLAAVTDGLSNTLAIVEIKEPFCWMDPKADISLKELTEGINQKEGRVSSFHPAGINAALFDGAVKFFSNEIDPKVLKALGTCAGREGD